MYLPLTLPLIDTDRMTPTNGGGKHSVSARAWVVVAFVLLAVLWQLVRLVVKG